MNLNKVLTLGELLYTTALEYRCTAGNEMYEDIIHLENQFKKISEFWGYEPDPNILRKFDSLIRELENE